MQINKKGLVFEPILVLSAILILSTAFYNIYTSENIFNKDIGKSSKELIELDREVKLDLPLLEQASLFYTYNSIALLGENSGHKIKDLSFCTNWNKLYEKCLLTSDKINENLKFYISQHYTKDSNAYLKKQNFEIKKQDIDIKTKDNKLLITFNFEDITFKNNNIEYTTNLNFQKEINYNLNKYVELYNKYHDQILEDCPKKEELEPGLTCEIMKEGQLEFLQFKYKNEKLYLGNKENSFEYPEELQPIINFKLLKVQKIQPSTPEQ